LILIILLEMKDVLGLQVPEKTFGQQARPRTLPERVEAVQELDWQALYVQVGAVRSWLVMEEWHERDAEVEEGVLVREEMKLA
jgi:hypothetical protein